MYTTCREVLTTLDKHLENVSALFLIKSVAVTYGRFIIQNNLNARSFSSTQKQYMTTSSFSDTAEKQKNSSY